MSHSNFGFGVTVGALLGMLFITGVAIAIRDQGREECDQKLPRTEKCVQKWVPEARTGLGSGLSDALQEKATVTGPSSVAPDSSAASAPWEAA